MEMDNNSTNGQINESESFEFLSVVQPEYLGSQELVASSIDEPNSDVTNKVRLNNQVLIQLLEQLKPIDFHIRAELSDGEQITTMHYLIITVEEIMATAKRNSWALCVTDGQIFIYNGIYWHSLSKPETLYFLGEAAERLGVERYEARFYSFRQSLLKQFFSLAYLPKPVRAYGEILINLQNGTFVITPEKQYLRGFDSQDFLTYVLPFDFHPEATCSTFDCYLKRVLPDKSQQKILAEFIGYVFVRNNTLKLEKSMILYGSGANGKSVMHEIITAMLGEENVSNYSLQSLTNDTGYFRAKIANKLVNYASEISTKMETTLFKQLVSGEPIEARLPYGEPFTLVDYAKFMFNTNELPKDVEHNEAFFRRFILLHFGVTIPEEERDPQLGQKIITGELAGVFNWVLNGLTRLLSQKGFTYSSIVEESLASYKKQSDSVALFLQDEGYQQDNQSQTALKLMYTDYREYCSQSGYKTLSQRFFSDRLRNHGYFLERKSKGTVVNAKRS
jgi:putative DNA primase/helicase